MVWIWLKEQLEKRGTKRDAEGRTGKSQQYTTPELKDILHNITV